MNIVYVVWFDNEIETIYDNFESAVNRGFYLIDNSYETEKFSKEEKKEMKHDLLKFWTCDYVIITDYELKK